MQFKSNFILFFLFIFTLTLVSCDKEDITNYDLNENSQTISDEVELRGSASTCNCNLRVKANTSSQNTFDNWGIDFEYKDANNVNQHINVGQMSIPYSTPNQWLIIPFTGKNNTNISSDIVLPVNDDELFYNGLNVELRVNCTTATLTPFTSEITVNGPLFLTVIEHEDGEIDDCAAIKQNNSNG